MHTQHGFQLSLHPRGHVHTYLSVYVSTCSGYMLCKPHSHTASHESAATSMQGTWPSSGFLTRLAPRGPGTGPPPCPWSELMMMPSSPVPGPAPHRQGLRTGWGRNPASRSRDQAGAQKVTPPVSLARHQDEATGHTVAAEGRGQALWSPLGGQEHGPPLASAVGVWGGRGGARSPGSPSSHLPGPCSLLELNGERPSQIHDFQISQTL